MKKELIESISAVIPKLEGWASVEKSLAMATLIEEEKPRCVVEIGVFGGRSLIPQAMAIRENGFGRIYGIDPWQVDPVLEGELADEDKKWWSEMVDLHSIHQGCMEAIWQNKLEPWSVIIRSTSQSAASLFPMIDILHIDGNHTELASCRDVELFVPRVKKKGMIWFDDSDWPTTQKAIAMLDKTCERANQIGNCLLFRKGKPLAPRKPKTAEPATQKESSSNSDTEQQTSVNSGKREEIVA